MEDLTQMLKLETYLKFSKIFYVRFTERKSHSSHRYTIWIAGGIKLSCCDKMFCMWGAGGLMEAMSNCDTKGIARY